MKRIAALYVQTGGSYFGIQDVDPWDKSRDARKYRGPDPVVAHPPCAAFCRLAGLRQHKYGYKKGEDDGCFAAALRAIRKYGGVLEHPAYSDAWPKFGLLRPTRGKWTSDGKGGWVTEVSQSAYGHRARKRTWLYVVSAKRPARLDWSDPETKAVVSGSHNHCKKPIDGAFRVWTREANKTPIRFRDTLIKIARKVTK